MNIEEIAERINEYSNNYEIGHLQEIRKEIKSKKITAKKIFNSQKFKGKTYAFHTGGRKEIQFNIGLNNDKLRYGLAFSLEKSAYCNSLEAALVPRIHRLNSLFKENPKIFHNYKLLCLENDKLINESVMMEIPETWMKLYPEHFIFFGKYMDVNSIDYKEILTTFDKLLKTIYLKIETDYETDDYFLEKK
jgi:hypothetical protein